MLDNGIKEFKGEAVQNESYLKKMVVIALPIIIQNLVFQIQTLINRAFLGNLKAEYLSAIGNTIVPYQASIDIVIAISTGLTIIVSRNIGARNKKEATDQMNTSISYNTLFSVLLFLMWFFLSNLIFGLMGVGRSLIGECNRYIRIISVYLIFFGADTTVQASLQGVGKTRPVMFAGIYKVVMNIFLDWSLIFGNFGFPKMEFIGAAIASAISNISAAVLLMAYVLFTDSLPVKIDLKSLMKPSWHKYKESMALGLPAGFENFAWQLGNLVLIRFLNGLSISAVGMYTIITSIEEIDCILFDGMSRGMLTLVGQKIGEGRMGDSVKIINDSIKYDMILVSFFFVIFVVFPKHILGIFTTDTRMINGSVLYFIIICITLYPKSLNIVAGNGIRAFGDTKWMLYTQILGTFFVIGVSYLLIYTLKLNLLAVYMTILMDESLRAVLNTTRLYRGRKAVIGFLPRKNC